MLRTVQRMACDVPESLKDSSREFDISISNMVSGQQAEQVTGSNPVTDILPWPVVLFLSLDSCLEFLS